MTDAAKRGGRRANAESSRERVVKIRLSDEEWVEITALAEAMGVSRPRVYTRAVETGGQVFDRVAVAQERARRVDAHLLVRVLSGAATNLNQIAHGMHVDGTVDQRELSHTLTRINAALDRINAMLDETGGAS